MRVHLEAAYVLHRRPYRDNSELVEAFCVEQGRVGLVARGLGRRRRGGSLGALLQPFRPVLLSFSGRGELLSLNQAEAGGELAPLYGDALLSGFYLNELLLRLLQRFEPNRVLFVTYAETLAALAAPQPIEPVLRRFEFALLDILGYAIDLRHDAESGAALDSDARYRLDPERGFLETSAAIAEQTGLYTGAELLAMARGDFESCAPRAKRLARALLQPHLRGGPLRSREMFATAVHRSGESESA